MAVGHGNEQERMSLVKRTSESRGDASVVTQGSKVRTGIEPTMKYDGMVWYDDPIYRLWNGSSWVNLAQKLISRTTLLAVDTAVVI